FRRERIVLDVIYNPAETRFLKIARERGCVTISGIEMFLSQAAKQFELFTGIPVSTEIIHQVWEEVR
ncbi:shikimate dehydrogenase, partial [Candidatus Saccharibacteria bacterium]|nr:shikimate dehydrogenase [Calditrichia bacterium]NIV72435.1 shikimate dehydrogenase [Calditrichia bacterium]NIW00040.1 shikimate dehydrogenase [Candidatus Saccharibacteria bacterium]NIW80219.1 shikimate dehydrogenase [Calditrichia bacterium]